MNENASDENTVTGKAMGNIMGVAASAAVLVGSAYAGTALLGKGVKGAKAVAGKAKNIATRKGASEEMSELGTKARKIMNEEGVSGSKATRMAKKEMKNEAHAKKLKDLAEYDEAPKIEQMREGIKNNSKKPSVTMKNGSGKTIHTDGKKIVDVTSEDLMSKMSLEDVKGYEEFLRNDNKQNINKNKDFINSKMPPSSKPDPYEQINNLSNTTSTPTPKNTSIFNSTEGVVPGGVIQ